MELTFGFARRIRVLIGILAIPLIVLLLANTYLLLSPSPAKLRLFDVLYNYVALPLLLFFVASIFVLSQCYYTLSVAAVGNILSLRRRSFLSGSIGIAYFKGLPFRVHCSGNVNAGDNLEAVNVRRSVWSVVLIAGNRS